MTACPECGHPPAWHDPEEDGVCANVHCYCQYPTPHVCQFCGTALRDHWWDPCTYAAADADVVPAPADCAICCPAGWSPNIDQVPDEDCPAHGRDAARQDAPLACWEKQLLASPVEIFDCALPQWHDGPCERDGGVA